MKIMNLGSNPIGEVFLQHTKEGVNIAAHYYGKGTSTIVKLLKPSDTVVNNSIEKRLMELEEFKHSVIPFIDYLASELDDVPDVNLTYKNYESFKSTVPFIPTETPNKDLPYVISNIDTKRP